MDSHFDQVMKSRSEATGAERLYFGYSTVLDRAAFEEWRAEHGYTFFELPPGEVAEALDVELVYDFPSRWWRGRVAGLADKPGSSVFGRVFKIAGKDWPIVQHKEGYVTGMCVERPLRVKLGNSIVEATGFTTRPERASLDGPISEMFVEALIRGAKSAGLPEKYVNTLKGSAR
jgi:hypothetical protein